jgi:hypothetical protein
MRIILCLMCLLSPLFAQQSPARSKAYQSAIDPLVQYSGFGETYFEDGAADGTVLETKLDKNNDPLPLPAPVKRIAALGAQAFPLLVECLSDARTTSATFSGGYSREPVKVPVGYVCLDILTQEIGFGPPVSYADCADDGLGACIHTEYFFRPDDYIPDGKERFIVRPWVLQVQRNWRKLLLQGRLTFRAPDALRQEAAREHRSHE